MATAPVSNVPSSETVESTERRFRELKAVWEADTMYLSDAHKIIAHPAFQEIIALGEAVIPFMLRDLEKEPGQWVWALSRITGANPYRPEDGGDSRKMAAAWVRWGRENGYRW
jgi:hypothetical protein